VNFRRLFLDYNHLSNELEQASMFDLWRLSCVINNLLDDPQKLEPLKKHLQEGQAISYFDSTANCLVEATIIQIKKKRVLVRNKHDGHQWNIPFYMVNLAGVDTNIKPQSTKKLDRQSLQVGCLVGWRSKDGRDHYGKIIKLNPKLAKIINTEGEVWRVHYSLLFAVMDSVTDNGGDDLNLKIIEPI